MYYLAEVRDIENDPSSSGRVKVRIYGQHNNEQKIKDDHLAWAAPLQPCTSAALGGIGITPVGLRVGSRVIVTYLADDVHKQYPIVLGSVSRSVEGNNVA